MSDRPRIIYIGVPTKLTLKRYRNKKTQQLFKGITTGTLKLYDDSNSTQLLLGGCGVLNCR